MLEKNFPKNIFFEKNLQKKIFFEKKFQKNIFQKKLQKKILRNFFLPTLAEVSLSWLKLEDNKIFLLQWVEVGWKG